MMFAPPQMPTSLFAGGGPRQFECGLDPFRDEGVGRAALHGQRLSRFVRHDEHRHPATFEFRE
jgi:hypothetical protein